MTSMGKFLDAHLERWGPHHMAINVIADGQDKDEQPRKEAVPRAGHIDFYEAFRVWTECQGKVQVLDHG